jgi:uncharacterized protein (TIGR02466 family)
MTEQTSTIQSIFPTPVYMVKRDTNLSPKEEKEIRKIIDKEGMGSNAGNTRSNNSYIFNGKLKKIKQFCEQHIKSYVEQVIIPEEEVDLYITQSWLNITKPGEYHHEHSHQNSIISGVFYISTVEDDSITFSDPNGRIKGLLTTQDPKEYNVWNSSTWSFGSVTNELMLFPSWLCHQVRVNEKATTDRISLSFNTFITGTLGTKRSLTELILK